MNNNVQGTLRIYIPAKPHNVIVFTALHNVDPNVNFSSRMIKLELSN